jgi:hypothetical protein
MWFVIRSMWFVVVAVVDSMWHMVMSVINVLTNLILMDTGSAISAYSGKATFGGHRFRYLLNFGINLPFADTGSVIWSY